MACPSNAIRHGETYRLDLARCDACGACTRVCPTKALFNIGRRYTVTELLSEVRRDAVFISLEDHKKHTGVDNDPILQNASGLVESSIPVTFRVPIVPGITVSQTNIEALGDFPKRSGVTEVSFAPIRTVGKESSPGFTRPMPHWGYPTFPRNTRQP